MATDVRPSDFLRDVISHSGISQADALPTGQSDSISHDSQSESQDDSAIALMKLAETAETKQQNRLKCSHCHAEFTIPLDLYRHMIRYHSLRKRFHCSECERRFNNAETLEKHTKNLHRNRKPFQCSVCHLRFSSKLAQQRHSTVHTWDKPHHCSVCRKTFRNKTVLKEHVRSCHNDKRRVCQACGKTFFNLAAFNQHSLSHGHLLFDCNDCDRLFTSAKKLAKHTETHRLNEKFSDKKLRCSFCDQFVLNLTDMVEHIRVAHPPNVKPMHTPIPVNHTTNFNCSECQVYYESYDDLSIHLEALHQLFQCRHCYLQYTSKQGLKNHIRQSHGASYALSCYICDKNFSDQGSLNRHVATHDQYTCPHCDSSFQDDKKLQHHQHHYHNPEIMETCSICSHQFGSKARLQRHLQCHLPPALRKCEICEAPFNQEKMVERHMEVVHNITKDRIEDPNTASQTYQIVQEGETVNVILVDGAGTEDLKAMVSAEMDQIFICNVCNSEFMEKEELNDHVSSHDVPELLLNIVEQERARATIAGAPVPKEILVSKSSERQRSESQADSDDDLDDLQHEAFMRSRPKTAPTVVVKRYTSTRCRYCDKLLASDHDLQVHEKMHVNNYDFRCTACNEEFVDGDDLIRHRRMHKKRLRRSFQCAHCGIIMNDANLMKQHIDTHSGFALEEGEQLQHPWKTGKTRENRFACQVCRLWFDSGRAYRKHLGTHRDGKAYHCKTCNRGYDRIATLKYHSKSHKAAEAHGCGLCSEKFDRSYRLTKHLMLKHEIGRFVCQHCDLRFKTSDEKRAHEKKHKTKDQYICAICDDTFVTVAGLKRHVRTHQTKVPETVRKPKEDPILEDGQSYWCMICQAVFSREEDLIAHGSKHFKCDACALEFADAMELECHCLDHAALERNICLNCGDSFESQNLLWEHTLNHHSDSTACRCEKCHRVLLSHRHSQIHMLTHPLEEAADYHCDYFCNMCQSIFTTESFMNIHNERHKPCQMCNDISDDLTLHLLQSHSLPQVEKCYHCDRVLTDPVARAEHLNTHAVSPEVLERCVECETGFADMEVLDTHIKTAHSLQALKCIVCGMLCLGKDDLNQHLRTEHLVYNIHNCNKCTKIFLNTTMDDMVEHALTHKPKLPLTCCSCEAKFDDQNLLRLHLQTHTVIENLYCCTECSTKKASLKELKDHNRSDHGIVQKSGGNQKVKCGICDTKMKMTSIESHVEKHLKKGKKFNCQICHFGFSTMASLERHVLTHTDERPVVCEICGQGFRNADRLRSHQFTHSEERVHHCPVEGCPDQFKLRTKLRDHLTRKHGFDAPYSCILCEQKFVFRSQLKDHMSKHGAGKIVTCPDCKQQFRSKDSLRMHQKRHHQKPKQCPCCLALILDPSSHVCPVTMATDPVAMATDQVAMGTDPVAIAMGQISQSQDTDGYVYIALDEGIETSCPICMMNFPSQEALSNHMILHQDVLAN